jgi:hypothetical protein
VRLNAAASSCVRSALAGPAQPATWLGATPAALYLRTAGTPGVLALLSHDAVRLPCALLLPTTTAELPLTSIVGPGGGALAGDAMIGDNSLEWTGPAGPVIVQAVREWAPAIVRPRPVTEEPLAVLQDALPAPAALGIDGAMLTLLTTEPGAAVAQLLGRGPGLTPAGDDVLAGFLVGARAFAVDAAALRAAVAALAPGRTTALSAALLWHAARGECIDEVADVVALLCGRAGRTGPGQAGHGRDGPALGRLLSVGHTSGAALASGLAAAAQAAVRAAAGLVIQTGGEAA